MTKEQKIREFIRDVEAITSSKIIGLDFISLEDEDGYSYQDYLLHSKKTDEYLKFLDENYFTDNPSLLLLSTLNEKIKSVIPSKSIGSKRIRLNYDAPKIPKDNFRKGTELSKKDIFYWNTWCNNISKFYPTCNSIYFVKLGFNNLVQTTALFIYFNTDVSSIDKRRKGWLTKASKAFLYEEAVNVFLPKHVDEIKLQSVRAAISQVMARNMSHNIGSHVLNNLTDGTILSKITNYECKSYQPYPAFKDLKEESKIIHQLAIYNNYVKCRMDYLSDITFGTPVMHTNKKVYDELYKDFDKVRLLLDHISGLSKNFQFQINFKLNNKPLTADNDILIALPNDLLGSQAFYNIIENVIRNTAKHNQKKSATTTFTVNFKEITEDLKKVADKELWYEVEIYDDVKISKINNLVNAQNNKLNQSVLNEKTNQLRNSSLGLLEMEASAAYLRKLDITSIEEETFHVEDDKKISNKHDKLNILKAFNKNGGLGYRFFVSKPTEFLFVGEFDLIDYQKKELSKNGIWIRTKDEFTKELKAGVVFNHQFLLSTSNGIEKFKTYLPIRYIPIDKNSRIVELLKSGSFENIEHWIWKEWFNKNKGSFECINVMTSYDDELYNQPNRYNIAISHHDTTIESCKNDFGKNINAFDVLSSNALNKLPSINGKELVDYIDQLKEDNVPNSITKFKLFEAYTNTVAVIDERIQRYSNEKYLELENKEINSYTNVLIPNEIELASDNYTKAITKKIETFAEKAIEESKCKFLVVHYSILERMYGSRDKRIDETLIKWSEKTRVIITSGRGKPPELPSKHVCYVNLSPILNAFTQVRSKYAINYLLNTARR